MDLKRLIFIDKDELLDNVYELMFAENDVKAREVYERVGGLIHRQRAICPEELRPTGRWEHGCVCSNCTTHCGPKNKRAALYYRYCPYCGARMEETT